jgi:hypothetical protein
LDDFEIAGHVERHLRDFANVAIVLYVKKFDHAAPLYGQF